MPIGRMNLECTPNASAAPSRFRRGWLPVSLVLTVMVLPGCNFLSQSRNQVSLPSRHSVRSDQLLVLSDFRISPQHTLIRDLKKLRRQVYRHLELPIQQRPVTVYLFDNEQVYSEYLAHMYPGLPHRRAYFFKTSRELAVFTYWGDRIQEDLRHEFTHGLLHASLKSVPLWLDEGLAEYFEVVGPEPGSLNSNYPAELMAKIGSGWRPDLKRLESLEEFADLQRLDYQESWAWVHFMLHHTPETRAALIGYLNDLRTQADPYPLSKRLQVAQTDVDNRFLSYVASLNTFSEPLQSPPLLQTADESSITPMDPAEPAGDGTAADSTGDEPGWVSLSSNKVEAQSGLPEYSVTLPDHVKGRMMLTGENGNVSFADGPETWRTAHRHGWDDFLRLFLNGEFSLNDPAAVKKFAENPSTEYWDLAREARKQGIFDCYQALKRQSAETGAQMLRKNFQPGGATGS
jgi:hypothetical protein